MPRYRIDLSYDGTAYFGWQSQPHRNTVQDVVEAALARVVGHSVALVGASRTDSGVHARQQVAMFRTGADLDEPMVIADRLTALLPDDIAVRRVVAVEERFHPAHAAIGKTYCYRILMRDKRLGGEHPHQWRVQYDVDLDVLRQELSAAVGTHDFTSFCAADCQKASRVRTIRSVDVRDAGEGAIEVWIEGPGFLKQMIRILVGTAVARASGKTGAPSVASALGGRDRRLAGRTAPAQGLTLEHIAYVGQSKRMSRP